MHFRLIAKLAFAALLFLVPSCATRPQFNPQTNSGLVIGATSLVESLKILGAPDHRDEIRNSKGQFTVLAYWYPTGTKNGDLAFNILDLTFKTNVLESYCYQNVTGKTVWRRIDLEKRLADIKKGVSTKDKVLQAFGEPTGHKYCRSSNDAPSQTFKNDHELWYWTQILQGQNHYRQFTVEFDANNVVVDFEESESLPNTPWNRIFGP